MDNFNIDNLYEETPEMNKFDVLQDYLDYKKIQMIRIKINFQKNIIFM